MGGAYRGPASGGGGRGPMLPVWILKCLVSVFINACRLLWALPTLSQFGQGRLSLVASSFYTQSLLFGPCRLWEFTLAGPPYRWIESHGVYSKKRSQHIYFLEENLLNLLHAIAKLRINVVPGCHWKFFVYCVT